MTTNCLEMSSSTKLAVCLNSVHKSFGLGREKNLVLQNVNLRVPCGSIYGLLGASGCGKTTLLKCVIGQIKPTSGIIRVIDNISGSNNSRRINVGYMPQEIALFGELTIRETLVYFGRIQMMTCSQIKERTEFMLEFLNLPTEWKLIKNFSGGQKRRVSFAIALLHEPPLLILDEPTVGMDPLLRISIWDHLVKISQSGKVTTIITTHYIEEAKQADKIGFLREGRILAEGNPDSLINRYQFSSLEDVYLHLCKNDLGSKKINDTKYDMQEKKQNQTEPLQEHEALNLLDDVVVQSTKNNRSILNTISKFFSVPNSQRILALTKKNLTKLRRQPSTLFLQFLVPCVLITLICLALDGIPHDLKFAVVNKDKFIGTRFLSLIDKTIIHQVPVDNREKAEYMVQTFEVWGIIHIWRNFSRGLIIRLYDSNSITKEIIDSSSIYVKMDMVEPQIVYTIKYELHRALQEFAKMSLANTERNDNSLASSPLNFEEPPYGTNDLNFSHYAVPGILIILSYYLAVTLTVIDFVAEKKEGLLERTYVAGLTPFELKCGHILSHLGTMIIQNALMLIILIYGFHFPISGNIIWIIFLSLLQGICGMFYGYFLSTLLDNEYAIPVVLVGSVLPAILICDVIWPDKAMPNYLQSISNLLPQTYATQAMRCIFSRGKSITFMLVWRGFLSTFIWINFLLFLTSVVMKLKERISR